MSAPNLFIIRTLAPVHIGCDEVYEPMAFVINEQARKLVSFDPHDFVVSLAAEDKKRFTEICRKGTVESILELYKFMKGKMVKGRFVDVCPGLVEHYQSTLGMSITDGKRIQQELNNFSISRTAFSSNSQVPYLPGSSIKGAFRTAWLNSLAQKRSGLPESSDLSAKGLERSLLDGGAFETDPLRMLKISDFMPVRVRTTRIVYAVNEKKNPSNYKRRLHPLLEVIAVDSVFAGTIDVLLPQPGAGIRNPLDMNTLLTSVGDFYLKQKKREDAEFEAMEIPSNVLATQQPGVLLRIGRHCGAESMTIEGHRRISIMEEKAKKHDSDHATSFWLASEVPKSYNKNQLKPFGWIELCNASQSSQGVGEAEEKPFDVVITETWEDSFLFWSPGNQLLTAVSGNKKATATGKDLVPSILHKKLFEKRKETKANVTVERKGTNYRIVKIEAPQS